MELSQAELESFYEALETSLYNFALRWVWNPSIAQELVQDAFVRVWQRRGRIERATLKPLLYKIVQNLAINERRRQKVRELTPLLGWLFDGEKTGVEEDFIRREDLQAMHRAIEGLPRDLRKTLLLCQFSDLSYEQIAEILTIPPGTVASRKNRAMRILKETVPDHRPEER